MGGQVGRPGGHEVRQGQGPGPRMLELQCSGHVMQTANSLEKTLMLERLRAGEGVTKDEMVGWYYHDGHELEQALTGEAGMLQSLGSEI